jgi:anhydro-N-acetylmuramic acid kinase
MIYRAIGLMSGSSLDGLDVVFTQLEEVRGEWSFTIEAAKCYEYNEEWRNRLREAVQLNAYEYLLLDVEYARHTAACVNAFIEEFNLHHKVQLIASHGHTVFHVPAKGMTAQLGDPATIAAQTGINVVSHLRQIDVALGGQGAPIVPVGEKLLFKEYNYLLNIGGIANISHNGDQYVAFDVCPANAVLNAIASLEDHLYDDKGQLAAAGTVNEPLLNALNASPYYSQAFPKSLANSFSKELFTLVSQHQLPVQDALATYVAHIAQQVAHALSQLQGDDASPATLLVTGGGALNHFLIMQLEEKLAPLNIQVVLPSETIIQYKEALIMALLGILRWREQNTVLDSVTGAGRSSIGGAVWIGQDA